MATSAHNCDANLLHQLLQDSLSEQQEQWLSEHLEDCQQCRSLLEQQAGGVSEWSHVRDVLRSEIRLQVDRPAALRSTLLPVDRSSLGEFPPVSAELNIDDFAVDFLQPSDRTDVLGTLNDIEIHSVIGQGGNGIVLKGLQPELNRLVAVKVMAPQLAASAAARMRFSREAQATAAIVHPAVMPILTVHSDGQLPYLVMPYVDCETLQQRLDREGALSAVDVLRIGQQVAEGLAAAHAQGLVHRDVKPANILLEKGVDRVMLTDFGLARAVDDGTLTRTGIIAGTPQFMSPEQARGDAVDTASDLFSLGSVLYAMCTGRPPFRAETTYGILRRVTDDSPTAIPLLNPAVPVWLSGYIGQLMHKHSEQRLASADMVAETLRGGLAHLQQPLTRPLPAALQSHHVRPWGRLLLVAVCATVAIAAIVFRPKGPRSPENTGQSGTQASVAAESRVSDSPTDSTAATNPSAAATLPEAATQAWTTSLDEDLNQLSAEADTLLSAPLFAE
ncbi:MAG: serine/threonine protein kinase [Planctomycetaceae bacterium]|nr:serine/threonine protein kinase [Planctomycetaceae bacterium]